MNSPETDASGRVSRPPARAAAEIAFVVLCVVLAEGAVIPLFGRRRTPGVILILMVFLFGFLSHKARKESGSESVSLSRSLS